MSKFTLCRAFALPCLTGLALLGTSAHAQLVINPIFDGSITSDPNAATIESSINTAIHVYETDFTNHVTVNIKFQEMNSGLGQSETFGTAINYSDYYAALVSHATTANDVLALAHLTPGPNNPVNGNTQISLTTANLRAVGFDVNPPNGDPDSTIGLNTSLMNLNRTNIDPDKYDLQAVASHEIDEVLGFGSALNGLQNGDPSPTGPIGTMDLFRYDQNGNRSLTTDPNAQAYFSLDGTNHLERFNQTQGGDFHDWFSDGPHTPAVQDAFGTPGVILDLGPAELTGLDVIGYVPKVTGTPAPGSLSIALLGAVPGVGLLLRRRRR